MLKKAHRATPLFNWGQDWGSRFLSNEYNADGKKSWEEYLIELSRIFDKGSHYRGGGGLTSPKWFRRMTMRQLRRKNKIGLDKDPEFYPDLRVRNWAWW